MNGGKLDEIIANQGKLDGIQTGVDEILVKLDDLSGGIGGGPTPGGDGCTVNININGLCCDCPTDPGPGGPDPVDPLCEQQGDVVVADGEVVRFKTSITSCNCPYDFFLTSSSLNQDLITGFEGYHGLSTATDFGQGLFSAKDNSVLAPYQDWTYVETEAIAAGLTGGQLRDQDGFCISTGLGLYNGENRAQSVPCATAADDILVLEAQLFFIENAAVADQVIIRSRCTELVLQQVIDCETKAHADEVYVGQSSCKLKHYDIAVVDQSQCETNPYNLNSCNW